ncbi:AcaB family transcriptional regulator [Vibrio breoganii]|uniref:AcaB family transcriptional regulator n=1 Tax=Vibrio breoganii TaxID=553239 RepID=UPI000C845EBE|nr:AcaB family transcriptional regulator [Vibrio breoganii]PML12706.1 hypothetical protein BCT84_02155 [Vibrio breoganii]
MAIQKTVVLEEDSADAKAVEPQIDITMTKAEQDSIGIVLHSKDALKLLNSETVSTGKNKKTFLPGLQWFDTRLTNVVNSAGNDDPFADQLLLDLERQIDTLGETIVAKTEDLQAKIKELFDYNEATLKKNVSAHIAEVSVKLNYPLSNRMLWVIKAVDRMLFLVYQAEKHNIIYTRAAKEYRTDAKRMVRNLFRSLNKFNHTGITRTDVAHATKRTEIAYNQNKDIALTLPVLLMEERADCAPYVATRHGDRLDKKTREKIVRLYADADRQSHEEISEDQLMKSESDAPSRGLDDALASEAAPDFAVQSVK